jgi:hypothetical protein
VLRLGTEVLAASAPPAIDVLADGTVREGGRILPGKLTRAQLQDLVREVVATQRFFEHDDAAVQRAMKAAFGTPRCGNGVETTAIDLVLKGKKGAIRVTMLRELAAQCPDVPSLVRAMAVVDRLRLEVRLAAAGGRAMVLQWLAAANARLAQRYPKRAPFTIEEFVAVEDLPPAGESILPKGWDPATDEMTGKCAVFERRWGTPEKILSAVVRVADVKPRAAVNVQE